LQAKEFPEQWKAYCGAAFISKNELALLERFDKKPDAEQLAILQKEGEAYAELFLTVLKHITDPLTTEYVLTLVDKYLTEDPTLCKAYSKLTTHLTLNPHAILFRSTGARFRGA
jgi:hypothetical protein